MNVHLQVCFEVVSAEVKMLNEDTGSLFPVCNFADLKESKTVVLLGQSLDL